MEGKTRRTDQMPSLYRVNEALEQLPFVFREAVANFVEGEGTPAPVPRPAACQPVAAALPVERFRAFRRLRRFWPPLL